MATWPDDGDTDWNTKMLAYLAVSFNTDGTPKSSVFNLGGYTTDDDDSNTMLAAHAYLANQDGTVYVIARTPSGGASTVTCYIDTDTNPASGGTIFAKKHESQYMDSGDIDSLNFDVASGEYWEVVVVNIDVLTLIWRSLNGTLVKCSDQD